MNLEPALNELIKRAEDENPQNECDYEVDGLLYCGVCHEPKDYVIPYCEGTPLSGRKVRVVCRCFIEKQEAEKEKERLKQIEERRRTAFNNPALRRVRFEDDLYPDSRLSKLCRGYVKHFDEMYLEGKGLLLFGAVGVGKTYYAACIANALLDRGRTVLFTSFSDLEQEKQRSGEEVKRADLLVIDDFGAERDTTYMEEFVNRIINVRVLVNKPLLITTNLDAESFEQPKSQHQQRVISRLYEICLPFRCKGEDLRKKALKSSFEQIKALLE